MTSPGGWIAAAALALLLTGWLVYPLVLAVAARLRHPARPVAGRQVPIAVVIATRETPDVVAGRVRDLLDTDYPTSLVQIVVAVDRDSPHPLEAYRAVVGVDEGALHGFVTLPGGAATLRLARAQDAPGKAAALDLGVRLASHETVVFADSAQRFDRDALGLLVGYLGDARFGAVSGRLCADHDAEKGSVLGTFWSYESLLRRLEARVHGIPAVTGAIYAIRRALWRRPPPGLICDDLFVPLSIARAGHRVGYCHEACARDPREFTRDQELNRKVRTLTGMIQMCVWQPWILAPWSNPVWLQFVCHKLIRLATPLLVATVGAGVAWELAALGWLTEFATGALYGACGALVALELRQRGAARRVALRAHLAVRLLLSPVVAMGHALRGNWNVWAPVTPVRRIS